MRILKTTILNGRRWFLIEDSLGRRRWVTVERLQQIQQPQPQPVNQYQPVKRKVPMQVRFCRGVWGKDKPPKQRKA